MLRPWLLLGLAALLALGCNSLLGIEAAHYDDPDASVGGSDAASGANSSAGRAGHTSSNAGSAGKPSGAAGMAGDEGSVGGSVENGGASGAGTAGGSSGAGVAGSPVSGGSGGMPATAGTGGSAAGGAGTSGSGGAPIIFPSGPSAGCNLAPQSGDVSTKFVVHTVQPVVNAVYQLGGMYAASSGPYDFTNRPYGIRLPVNYDKTKQYAVTFSGSSCGSNASDFAQNPIGGLIIDPSQSTIQVGLAYITTCFVYGGNAIGNRSDSPEEPYFRAVLADVEAHYCVDRARVFMSGVSTVASLSYVLGCAASDVVRGIYTDEGQPPDAHPACKGPVAAVLVAGASDSTDPIGPLTDSTDIMKIGSHGIAPARDEILARNGCVGTATVAYDSPYGACVKYSGCPAKYPVLWCELPGIGHNSSTYMGVNYAPGPGWGVLGTLPAP